MRQVRSAPAPALGIALHSDRSGTRLAPEHFCGSVFGGCENSSWEWRRLP